MVRWWSVRVTPGAVSMEVFSMFSAEAVEALGIPVDILREGLILRLEVAWMLGVWV